MATTKEELHEAFGELIYAVAKADGEVQDEEKKKLTELLSESPWASEILWSFDYETGKNNDLEYVYKKALDECAEYGPSHEYTEFIEVLTQVADAFEGITPEERDIIDNFQKDLLERFRNDPNING